MTTDAGDRAHLSIGEVLTNLRDEFPDVTISKIRFLESQGLIDPERTPSGYRKFYADDLERLRWILFQQREHFLPLRVIKERLDRFGPAGAPPADSANGDEPSEAEPSPVARDDATPIVRRAPARQQRSRPRAVNTPKLPLDAADEDVPEERVGDLDPDDAEPVASDLTREVLLREAGITDAQLAELESYALVVPLVGEGERALYDPDAIVVARLAAGFRSRGIEPRHLKMYQHIADREAGLFAQVLLPLVKQKNPMASEKLQGELEELARLGRQLRTALLRASLQQALTE